MPRSAVVLAKSQLQDSEPELDSIGSGNGGGGAAVVLVVVKSADGGTVATVRCCGFRRPDDVVLEALREEAEAGCGLSSFRLRPASSW